MKCTKCGRDTEENAVFCQRCLQDMANHPVKPGTVIQLPQRKLTSPKKSSSRKRHLPPEELVIRQKRTIRWLWLALISMAFMLALSIALLLHINQEQPTAETIGQNYMTREDTTR